MFVLILYAYLHVGKWITSESRFLNTCFSHIVTFLLARWVLLYIVQSMYTHAGTVQPTAMWWTRIVWCGSHGASVIIPETFFSYNQGDASIPSYRHIISGTFLLCTPKQAETGYRSTESVLAVPSHILYISTAQLLVRKEGKRPPRCFNQNLYSNAPSVYPHAATYMLIINCSSTCMYNLHSIS